MKKELSASFLLLLFALALALLIGCGARTNNGQRQGELMPANNQAINGQESANGQKADGREVAPGEHFTIRRNEKVSVKGTRLILQLKDLRISMLANGQGESVEANISTTLDAKEHERWIKIGEDLEVGDYVIKLSEADPFDKNTAGLVVTHQ